MKLLAWLACSSSPPDPQPEPVDLSAPLSPGEARAGVVEDEAVLFGGIGAEGRAGDVLLMNARVRFVVQAARQGSWYLSHGGTIVDADVVRPEGQIGRDVVEEWSPIVGFARVPVPDSVQVLLDGRQGGPAVVRVVAQEAPLGLILGALEADPSFIPNLGLTFVTDYVLQPDSWLLEVRTTVAATAADAPGLKVGDVLIAGPEVTDTFHPGLGLGGGASGDWEWTAFVGDHNDVALGMVAAPGRTMDSDGGELLTELADMVVAYDGGIDLAAGESTTFVRYYGVAPDLATLTDAALALRGQAVASVNGVVTAPDGPVAGSRVNVLVEGEPFTIAVTDADGRFEADVPAGSNPTVEAVGRGPGLFLDLPEGAAPVSPYAATPVLQRGLEALSSGAVAVPRAEGRGVASADDPLALGEPARLVVRVADGLPFTTRVAFTQPDPSVDRARVPGRPDGLAAAGWSRDGEIELLVEPGTYDLVVHRGMRYELHTEPVTLTAGQVTTVEATLPKAFEHPGWLLGDPHMHASPSTDGEVPMVDRLVGAAALGLQVHFGTDHDHLADYRPLLEPLGLEPLLASIVSDEVSPPLRGHFNIYPVEPTPEEANGGAWTWWLETPASTEWLVDRLRERHGPGFVLQSNHPTGNGVADASGWRPGEVPRADLWTERLEAIEVLNAASTEGDLDFWMDLVVRGYEVAPTGVSDSHSHFGGSVGLSATFLKVGTDDPSSLTPVALQDALRAGHTVPSRGVFLATDRDPGTTFSGASALSVEARSASWARVDRLVLLRDGAEVERVDGRVGTFELSPESDAVYVVVAEGDAPMAPLSSRTPWALAGPFRVDVGGDGFTPPVPPLSFD